ncbi:MAG: OmpA family protein [Leptospirales bacterium]
MDSSHRADILRNVHISGTGFIVLHIPFSALIILLSWTFLFFSPTESIAQSQESSAEKTPSSRLKEHDRILLQKIRELSRKDLTFSTGKSFLTERDKRLLIRDAIILIHHPEVEILLVGHTDERGSTPYNMRLGILRGKSAKDFLMSLGVNSRRIHLVSFGKRSIPGRLLCSEHRENCWKLHRIVHIVGYLPNEVMTFQNAPPPAPSPNSNTRNVTFQGKKAKPGTFLLLPAGKVEVQNVLMYISYSSTQVAQQNFSLFPIVFPSSGVNIQSIEDDY